MSNTVHVVDRDTAGGWGAALTLQVAERTLTAREVVRRRVFELHAQAKNPSRRKTRWEADVQALLTAFEAHRILVIAGGRQLATLDDEIEITPDMQVQFIRLVPLVGG